jgi:mRNA interferase MazF
MIELRRGDVVLVSFPFMGKDGPETKRRPALVVQSDRYNRRRNALILAAVTSSLKGRDLPSKVFVARDSVEGREAGLRTDSVVDCQTLVTLPRSEIVACLGRLSTRLLSAVDHALRDSLGLGP